MDEFYTSDVQFKIWADEAALEAEMDLLMAEYPSDFDFEDDDEYGYEDEELSYFDEE